MKPKVLYINLKKVLSKLFFAIVLLCGLSFSASANAYKNIADPVITTDANTIVGLNSRYGTLNGSTSTSFKVSGTDIVGGISITAPSGFEISTGSAYTNTIVVGGSGTVVSTTVYVRLKVTAPVGDYSGNVVLSSGATSVNLPVLKSTVSKADLSIAGGNRIKVYGDTWVDTEAGKDFITGGLANGETIGAVSLHYGQGGAATDSAQRYTGSIMAYGATGGTFDPNNYNIKYVASDIFVVPAKLTLVADDKTRYFGEANPVFTYHGVGFVNGEDIGILDKKPTITTTATTTSPVGKYNIHPDNAFAGNYNITYTDATLTIEAERPPIISTTGILSATNTVYGSASATSTFSVSGDGIKDGGIAVTTPAGFEVSTDNITFSPTLKVGNSGTVNSTRVYVRLAAGANIGTHSGNVVLKSGVTTVNVPTASSEVTAVPLTITVNTIIKPYGTTLTNGPASAGFTAQGLVNGETIGSVYLTYSAGTAATDVLKTYPGAVTPSAATGGTFTAANYTITYQAGDLVIGPAPLTITADNKSRFFKDPDPVFTFKYSGFVNGETEAVLTSQPVISTTATIASPIGKYPITISGAAAANYTIIYVPGVLTVSSRQVMVANAFTPNGDGVNDTWDIENITQYPHCTVQVFNRYGEKMFYSVGYPEAWAGKRNGAMLPVGTYYYIIKLDDSIKPLTGYLAIIR